MFDLRTRLTRLGHNLWWSWSSELDPIFRAIDVELWRNVNHNPIAFLRDVDGSRLEWAEDDAHVIAQVIRAEKRMTDYLQSDNHWASWRAPGLAAFPVAYFSPEFCIHESLPIYSGGLGVLADDHLKSCSDLGVPTYGITLLYREGYFTQQINASGWQQESYQPLDTTRVPLEPVKGTDGSTLSVHLDINGEHVPCEIWRAAVGRCTLLLLDIRESADSAFAHALRLYGGDNVTRIAQEIALGVGGYRALRALGVRPGVLHLNEGHSAFAVLEAIADRMQATGLSFAQVSTEISEQVAFTTHTPVEAGHDRFEPELLLRSLAPLRRRLGLSEKELLALGRVDPANRHEPFCMTVLALKLSRRTNAVSSLHGMVTRRMWHGLWPERRTTEVPIGHITNGAHVHTWLAEELSQLYADTLGSDWRHHLCDSAYWRKVRQLDEVELWSLKLALKQRLLRFLRRREEARHARLGLDEPIGNLRPEVLTIGFARRFAAYKRSMLLFGDMDRTKRLLTHPERPVQLVIAGKAHPADDGGKRLLQRLYELARDPDLRDHLVIVENHDKNVGRHLLEGCDLWLNAPRRPLEACGTSGMKAVFNGTLNCSTLDGWWDEAYDGSNGFAFGDGFVHRDPETQDRHDAAALLEVLEQRVVPLYYDRDSRHIPSRWIGMIKHALQTLAWRYNSDRMVMDYVRTMYLAASATQTAEIR